MFFFRKKRPPEQSAAERLNGMELMYAARRCLDENGAPQEEILGKGGRINTANGHVILTCGEKDVFVNGDLTTVECGELLSKKGAIFTGVNELTGEEDTIVTYYTARFRD